MTRLRCAAAGLLVLAALTGSRAEGTKDEGFVPMFNGTDLTGWVNVNCAPGTFFVKNGEVITTGKPTGYLRTARQYENFIADFEWMHVNTKEVGNSGFFVWADPLPAVGTPYTRGIEVQVLVNLDKPGYYTSQGDLFSIWGATCKPDRPHPHGWMRCLPSENRCKGGGQWNHYRVIARDGTIKLHVNGKEVSGLSQCHPRKGYLALESEGAECHFRNLKIKELPSSNPRPEDVAREARGFKNLYTGLDLSGWKADAEARKHWQPRDWILSHEGKGAALSTAKDYGDAELIADFRFPEKAGKTDSCTFLFRQGADASVRLTVTPNALSTAVGQRPAVESNGKPFRDLHPAGQWNRLHATLAGKSLRVEINGKAAAEADLSAVRASGPFGLEAEGALEFANLFVLDR